MYNIKLDNYVPKPRPATSDRIVAAHYYPAWKKGAAGIHNGFDDLHSFPERTPLMGYYDEENPMVCDFEIKWALEHGINCFIHCWYRKKENEGKPVTVDDIRCSHGIHEALFNAKYQDMMKFAIMYENNPRWGQTNPDDLLENLLPFWTDNYFKRNNYLKIDNKPVLIICIKSRFDSVFESAEQQRTVFDKCREYVKNQGFDGLYISVCLWESESTFDEKEYLDCDARGYDFHISYNCGYSPEKSFPPEQEVIEGQCRHLKRRLAPNPIKHVPVASCFRDATPRTSEAWNSMGYKFGDETIYHLSPEGFREVVGRMKKICDELPDTAIGKRIFMIDNWNEWDEGHYVSPSHEFGFKYLQAIREELTERDNLPDYRTPQDMGFTELNKSWQVPDLSEICKEKFLDKKG